MALDSLQSLLINELKDVYSAEKQALKALPRLAKAASSPTLRDAFTTHRTETEEQVRRLERIFETLGVSGRGRPCKGMQGLVEEGQEAIEEDGEEAVLDAGLIAAAQRQEHYEIAAYGCLVTYAQLLGQQEVVQLLKQTLDEEERTDRLLTEIAEREVNPAAAAVGSMMGGEEGAMGEGGMEGARGGRGGSRGGARGRSASGSRGGRKSTSGGTRGRAKSASKRSGGRRSTRGER